MADLGLSLYRMAAGLSTPLAGMLVRQRLGRGKEIQGRTQERFGSATLARPAGQLIWVHAASIGEVNSIMPLLEAISARREDLSILLTTGTATSARLAQARAPANVIHQFVPFDITGSLNRFLDAWRPSAAFFVESEIWPNTIMALGRRDIPMVLVNARMSERSARRWRLAGRSIRTLLQNFSLCLAQSHGDAERLRGLGAGNLMVTGNLKLDVPAPPADPAMLRALEQALESRSVLTAASTHAGEDSILAEAHAGIERAAPGHLTIIVPRHPQRGGEIAAALRAGGLSCQLRSQQPLPGRSAAIYICDTLGEMGLWYRLAGSVFMGGSLVRHGGQNPIEPAKLKRAVLHGPHVDNFADIYRSLDDQGGARQVASAGALAEAVIEMRRMPQAREAMAGKAFACVTSMGGALRETLGAIQPYLPEPAE